jgi:putative endonuclease
MFNVNGKSMGNAEKRWVLYMLECGDSTLYTGITNDLKQRLKRHQAGKGARYTRGRLPVRLVYAERCKNRGVALRKEHALKRCRRTVKRALIEKAGKCAP